MKTVVEEKYTCPVCGEHEFIKFFADDGLYICKNYVGDEDAHTGRFAAVYCKECKKEYPSYRFGEIDKIFECKECGRKQWGLTEYWKDCINFSSQINRKKHRFIEKEEKE